MEKYILKLKDEIGFDLLGVTNGSTLGTNILQDKISRREITEFESKDIASRTDPSFHLEGVKTIFVFAMSYYWDVEDTDERYSISKYTRGMDYHKVLISKIQEFDKRLKEIYSYNSKVQVDMGALQEKLIAQRAGIGNIGKNTLLINEKYGSFIFLGLLLTDLEMETSEHKAKDICGSCNLCVENCPTKALLGDRTMDPRKCLSYLSQSKDIHLHSKNLIRTYGCDICQDICPYNQKIKSNIHPEFEPVITGFNKAEIIEMSNRKFRSKYSDFAFSWVGRKTILRNMEIIDMNPGYVGVLSIKIRIYDSFSLKDKRRILKSIEDRIKSKFNVSFSELDYQDIHNLSLIGITNISNKYEYTQEVLDSVLRYLDDSSDYEIIESFKEIL